MKIIDLNGKVIEVENINLALLQADDYRHYRVNKPTENDLNRYAYWEDIYQKLLHLKMEEL
ncbi:3-isopropylmalate dehydratase [Mucilaginibacter sp. KACC 22063]|uniref:3-isopropylmalate dehydratase n=1 Tax=Mucilaginibacter sp. KACC 22063 TaxID=3025666 RepID=UPI002365D7E6|nr:3-isopropylmalate dehydratase [Mucilaginibacter sp. KACC 22063]WDF55803.1 3-isopropylmalate dehydratase [Mucilaginibacter sp. KACC 22063]